MDTIRLTSAFCDDSPKRKNFEALNDDKSNNAPPGCSAWISSLDPVHYCNVHIRCHDICSYRKATRASERRIKRIVNEWLEKFGLTVDDFIVSRIDYDFNVRLPQFGPEIMEALQQGKLHAVYMKKKDIPKGYRYGNKSRCVLWYDKEKERIAKVGKVRADEKYIYREEIQCRSPFLKYVNKRYGIPRTWDHWVSVEREKYYQEKHRELFPSGKFYTVAKATDVIEESSLTPHYKARLVKILKMIRDSGMDSLFGAFSINTVKTYLKLLTDLDICPFPLAENCGVDQIDNPFHKTVAPKKCTPGK